MLFNPEIVVIGAGVIGLTTGIQLLEQYERVMIIADRISPMTTSDVAAAFWDPYKVHPWQRVRSWAKYSLDQFYQLAELPRTGVSITTMIQGFGECTEPPEWAELVRKVHIANEEELPFGCSRAFVAETAMIDTSYYMPFLVSRFEGMGGKIEKVQHALTLDSLQTDNRIIVNCTGIGARHFALDPEVFPMRGQVVRVSRPGTSKILVRDTPGITYVVPRHNDCVLGGTVEIDDWSLEPNSETAKRIISNCRELLPELSNCQVLEHKVGLRPGRSAVRLELIQTSNSSATVHNYGHGGAGFTLSWGCAAEASDLVRQWIQMQQ